MCEEPEENIILTHKVFNNKKSHKEFLDLKIVSRQKLAEVARKTVFF